MGDCGAVKEIPGYLASRKLVLQAEHAGHFVRHSHVLETEVIGGPGSGGNEAPDVSWVLSSSSVDEEQVA